MFGAREPGAVRTTVVMSVGMAGVVAAGLLGANLTLAEPGSREHGRVRLGAMDRPEQVAVEARRLYERFAGTMKQRNAGFVLRAHALGAGVDECVAEEGYDEWDWSRSRGYAAPVDPLRATVWFAQPFGRPFSKSLVALDPFLEAQADPPSGNGNGDPGVENVVVACRDEVPRVSRKDADEVTTPAGVPELRTVWRDTMASAGPAIGGPVARYYSCLDGKHLSVLEAADAPAVDLAEAMSGLAPGHEDIPRDPDDPTADSTAWQGLLEAEDEVMREDWWCRKEVYNAGIARLVPVMEEFVRDYADEILRAERAWEDIMARARELGYDGSSGPLG